MGTPMSVMPCASVDTVQQHRQQHEAFSQDRHEQTPEMHLGATQVQENRTVRRRMPEDEDTFSDNATV